MVIIKNRKLLVPDDDRFIGTNYDNESGYLTFQIDRYDQNEIDRAGFLARADIVYTDDKSKDRVSLTKEVQDEYIILTLTITNGMLQHPGSLLLDIKMYEYQGNIRWASFPGVFYVETGNQQTTPTSDQLTELEQMEVRIEQALAQLDAYVEGEMADQIAEWIEDNIDAATMEALIEQIASQISFGASFQDTGLYITTE